MIAGLAILVLGAVNLSAQEGAPPPAPEAAVPGGIAPQPVGAAPLASAQTIPYGYGGYQGQPYPGPGCPGGCYDQCCDCDECGGCGRGRFFHDEFYDNDGRGIMFGSVDALVWWSKGIRTPPLATTSPPGTPFAQAGVLPAAQVLAGGSNLYGTDLRIGGRAMVGRWINGDRTVGIGGRFSMIDSIQRNQNFGSVNGSPILAVPFFDLAGPANNSFPVAFPLGPDNIQREGSIQIGSAQQFMSAEAFNRVMMIESPNFRVDLMSGYHFARIDSSFEIRTDTLILADPIFAPGTEFSGVDRFKTENEFHGMEVGFIMDRRSGRWGFSSLAKVSYGAMIQRTRITGENTATIQPFPPATSAGNVFTQPSNIGNYTRTLGVFAPEVQMNMTYHIAPRLSLSGGYTFIWFNKVASAGDAINPNLNTIVFPPPANPSFAFKDNDFWVMGANFGLNWDF